MGVVRTRGLVFVAAGAVVVTGKSCVAWRAAGCMAWAVARSITRSITWTIATTAAVA